MLRRHSWKGALGGLHKDIKPGYRVTKLVFLIRSSVVLVLGVTLDNQDNMAIWKICWLVGRLGVFSLTRPTPDGVPVPCTVVLVLVVRLHSLINLYVSYD